MRGLILGYLWYLLFKKSKIIALSIIGLLFYSFILLITIAVDKNTLTDKEIKNIKLIQAPARFAFETSIRGLVYILDKTDNTKK